MATDLLLKIGSDVKGFVDGLGEVTAQVDKTVEGTTVKIGGLDAMMAGAFAKFGANIQDQVVGAVKDLGKEFINIGFAFDESFDKLQIGTGATGDALAALGESTKNIFKTIPSSLDAVTTAITTLTQRTEQTGPGLEAVATQMLNLSRITGESLKPLIEKTTGAMNAWKISTADQGGALDFLFKASQSSGVAVSELAIGVGALALTGKQVGLDFQTSAALIAKFGEAGISSDIVIGGLNKALVAFAKAGITDAKGALESLIIQIKGAGTESAGNELAITAFGKSGVKMAEAIRGGNLDLAAFTEQLKSSSGTINQTAKDTADAAEAWQTFKNALSVALEPLSSGLFNALNVVAIPLLKGLGQILEDNAAGFAMWGQAFTIAGNALEVVRLIVVGLWEKIQPLVTQVKDLGVAFANWGLEKLTNLVSPIVTAFEKMKSALFDTTSGARDAATAFDNWALAKWTDVVNSVKEAFASLIGWLEKIPGVSGAFDNLKTNLDAFGSSTKNAAGETKKLGPELDEATKRHLAAEEAARRHAQQLDLTGKAAKQAAEYQKELQAALQLFNIDADGGEGKIAKLKAGLDFLHDAWEKGAISTKAYWEAMVKYQEEVKKADPATVALKNTMKDLGVSMEKLHSETIESLNKKMETLEKGLKSGALSQEQYDAGWEEIAKRLDHLVQPLYELDKAIEEMDKSMKEAGGNIKLATLDVNALAAAYPHLTEAVLASNAAHREAALSSMLLKDEINQIVDRAAAEVHATQDVSDAYKILNVKSSAELRAKAQAAVDAYKTIAASGADAREKQEAYTAAVKATKEAYEGLGGIGAKLSKGLSAGLGGMAGGFLSNLFGGKEDTAAIDKQKELLAKASENLAAYRADAETQLDGLDAKWQASADKQIATEEKAFDKKAAEFADYQEDIAKKIGALDGKYEAAAQKDIAAARKSLDAKQKDYDKYVGDTGKQLEQITKKHADELEKQERDARRSLADKLSDLEDYQRDANTKLARVGEDLAAKNEHERQDYKDTLDRKLLDLDQYRAQVGLKLEQLKGDNSTNATKQREDLLLSLQQREQDFLLWKNQAAAHLEAVTTANTTQANRQRTDIQTSLNDRQSDFNQYKLDTEAKIIELSAAQSAKAEEERAAIQAKLTERTTDFDTYKSDIATKIEEIKQTALTKAQEEKDGLLAKLGEKQADFLAYKDDIAGKIEGIKQAAFDAAQKEKDEIKSKLDEKTADFETYKKDVNDKIEAIRKENENKTGDMGKKWETFTKDAGGAVGTMATGMIDKLFNKGKPDSVASKNEAEVPGMHKVWTDLSSAIGGTIGTLATDIGKKLFTGEGSWKQVGLDALGKLTQGFIQMGIDWALEAGNIATKITGIFGSIKIPALPSIPNVGGGTTTTGGTSPVDVSGIASATSSGMSAIVTAAASVASAISGIIGNFQQARQENTLNAIEENTRDTESEVRNLRADAWARETNYMTKWDSLFTATWVKMDEHASFTWLKLDAIINGGITGGGGGVAEAALQSIETSATAINDQMGGFRGEVSTGFYNAAVQGDVIIGALQSIAGNTVPIEGGETISVSASSVEEGLRNVNLTTQGVYNALAPLADIRDTLSAMRNNIGNIIGIKEAIVGQLGMIHGQLADHVVTMLSSIDNKLQPVYNYYLKLTNSGAAVGPATASTAATVTSAISTALTSTTSPLATATNAATAATHTQAAATTAATTATHVQTTAAVENTEAVTTLTGSVIALTAATAETDAARVARERQERANAAADDRARTEQLAREAAARTADADARARAEQETRDAAARARGAQPATGSGVASWLSAGSMQSLMQSLAGASADTIRSLTATMDSGAFLRAAQAAANVGGADMRGLYNRIADVLSRPSGVSVSIDSVTLGAGVSRDTAVAFGQSVGDQLARSLALGGTS